MDVLKSSFVEASLDLFGVISGCRVRVSPVEVSGRFLKNS